MALTKAIIFSTTTRQGGPQLANSVSSATGVFGAIYGDFNGGFNQQQWEFNCLTNRNDGRIWDFMGLSHFFLSYKVVPPR